MQAAFRQLSIIFRKTILSTADLSAAFPEWSVDKIDEKTGIRERHIAASDECASDMAVRRCGSLFASGACQPDAVDYLLFCTQSPDYFLPTTACSYRTPGIPRTAGALDSISAALALFTD